MPHKPTLVRIRIYPVKSLSGFDRDVWELDAFGLRYDRRWMIVGPDGRFMTQRDFPGMAEIAVEMQADRLILSVPMRTPVAVPLEPEPGASEPVTIWGDTVAARAVSEDANRWLGEVLQTPCRLVYMPDESGRSVDSRYVKHNAQVAFSDGFPLLLTSEESLAELNRRLADPVPMDRFRPNLVVRGIGDPHAEDTWRRIRISDMEFHVVKPCSRCVIVSTDQVTGERGAEPLETLARYRSAGGDVYFGQNLVHLGHGRIRVGDDVQVLEAGDPVPVPEPGQAGASGGRSAPSAEKKDHPEPAFELYLPESDEELEFEPAQPEPDPEPSTAAGTDSEREGEAEEEAAKTPMDDIIFPFEVDLVVTPEDLKEAAMEDEAAESEATPEEMFDAALEASFGPGLVEEEPAETDAGQEEPAPEEGLSEEAAAEVADDEAVAEEPAAEEEAAEEEAEAEEAEAEEAAEEELVAAEEAVEEEAAEEEAVEEELVAEEEAAAEEAAEEEAEAEEAEAEEEEAEEGKRKKRRKGKRAKAAVGDIEFELGGRPEGRAITALYEAAGRPEVAGDQDPGRIERAFDASNVVVAAWLGKVLVGVLRGWSDGARDGFISDLVVHPDHVGAGIGVQMVQHAMNAHPGVRWVLRSSATSPYLGSSLGWTHLGGGWFVSPA